MLVERDPHQLIEGIVITSYAIQCHHAFIYLRGEFALGRRAARAGARRCVRTWLRRQEHPRLRASTSRSSCTAARVATSPVTRRACSRASRANAPCRGSSRRSPRCRACTRRPRSSTTSRRCRPSRTSSTAAASGTRRWASTAPPGTRIFSVSGNVERPGNYEVELGMTFRELIYDLAGGIKGGKGLGFFIPGGASSPWLIEEHLDAPLDMDSVQSELKTDARLRGDHGLRRRPSTRCWSRGASPSSSPTSRAASARPAARARVGSRRCSTAWRTATGAPRTSTSSSGSATTSRPGSRGRPGMTTICQLGPEHHVAGGEPAELLVRRDQGTHDA